MHLHEYQAKMILKDVGVPSPSFALIKSPEEALDVWDTLVKSPEEALEVIDTLGLDKGVLKIQVHAGGRGKGGGIKIVKNRNELTSAVKELLQLKLVNNQTGSQGLKANVLMLSPLSEIKKEYYLAATIDRDKAQAILIASPQGGMDIEEVAQKDPKQILVLPITPEGTLRTFQLTHLAKFMGWSGEIANQGKQIAKGVAKLFVFADASLIEINPLILDGEDQLVALDAKITIDDNALFRQPLLAQCFDPSQLTPNEVRARECDLAYVALDGSIGCMVNGAGLAMATMDIIQHYGGSPANFLDVGGSADEARIAEGFKILLSDPHVKAILVNIFGGIMNCVTLAAGIISAAMELGVHVPLIVRLEGTNVERGKKMIQDSGLNIMLADTLEDAAQKAVAAVIT